MSWLGSRPHECGAGHWFAVGQWTERKPLACPLCHSTEVRYLGDANIPIFALVVEDVWNMKSDDEDEANFKELSVDDCLELGIDVETPWDAIEALAEMALEAKTSAG